MKVFVIGSVSQEDIIKNVASDYLSSECEVRYVSRQPSVDRETLIWKAFTNIMWADLVVAVSKPDGSFGDGTKYEMIFAMFNAKTVIIQPFDKYNA